ncbi:MAG: glycosyltransferase [Planctomycetes bacterium]|nr:glycosyltransferase [Planctomycetota bacterium]
MTSSPPRIDVLLPVRRARRTLPSAVGDVLAQRGVEVRVLAVVDRDADGRDDGSAAWLAEGVTGESRLIVLDGPGRGAAAALQLALEHTEAELVAHMEADDRCPPDRLARLVAALAADPTLDGVVSRAGQIGARTPGMRRYLDWQNALLSGARMAAERFVEIPALHQTGLYRRRALLAAGGYVPRGDWPIDIDFWFRWFEQGLSVVKLPRVLYHWRQHRAQSTRAGGAHALDVLRAAKADALARLFGRAGRTPRALRVVSTGATLRRWTDALAAHDVELRAPCAWRPGQAPPALDDDALLLAAYGMPSAREALRVALGRPAEPERLLFCA